MKLNTWLDEDNVIEGKLIKILQSNLDASKLFLQCLAEHTIDFIKVLHRLNSTLVIEHMNFNDHNAHHFRLLFHSRRGSFSIDSYKHNDDSIDKLYLLSPVHFSQFISDLREVTGIDKIKVDLTIDTKKYIEWIESLPGRTSAVR